MAKYIIQLILLISTLQAGASGFKVKVDSAISLISIDLQKSRELSEMWLKEASDEEDLFGIVKLNYTLGYISKKEGNYGQGAIYYLEALRWTSKGSYEGIENDVIAFHKNLANIYKRFSHFELAKKHYEIAMELAFESGNFNEYCSIIYNSSRLLQNEGDHELALQQLNSTFNNFHQINNDLIAKIYNQTGLLQTEMGHFSDANATFLKLIDFLATKQKLSLKYLGRAKHNIGNSYFQQENFMLAEKFFLDAFKIHKENSAKSSMFISAKDLGDTYMREKKYRLAKHYLEIAETLYPFSKRHDAHYEVYKLLGTLHKENGDFLKASEYQEKYASKLEEFLNEQHAIEQNDKKYNLDLITQRYFAMVAEQERNAQLTYYSTVGASSLVSIILLILAYFQFRKYRLKRTLEDALRPFTESI